MHPDLNSYQARYEGMSITLLGFILDPDNPQASDAAVINGLIHRLFNFDRFFEETDKLGGRWILIVNDGQEIRLFNDPFGLRQLFYTEKSASSALWCASQPELLAESLNLQIDKDAADFIDSYEFRRKEEYWWQVTLQRQ